jgi:hypothetical protein
MASSILVVLYNCSLEQSETIKALKLTKVNIFGTTLVLYNNGPIKIDGNLVSELNNKGYKCSIIQDTNNNPLSYIYNQFVKDNPNDHYIILDHDSKLSNEYIDTIINNNIKGVGLPIVKSANKVCSPNKFPKKTSTSFGRRDKIVAIGSGLIISHSFSELIIQKYGNLFDEHYALYGVDTSFLLRIRKMKAINQLSIIPGFDHSLSRDENESKSKQQFRKIEMGYHTALTLRYYPSFSSLKRFRKVLIESFSSKNKELTSVLLNTLLTGKHPRCN